MDAVTHDEIARLLDLAVDLAHGGARRHREGRASALEVGEKAGGPFDLVTRVDRESERIIVERIADRRPDDAIVAEEGGTRPGTSGITWVIDPLDGTANYVYGYPAHAVSIGIEIDGAAVAGVVFDTARDVVHAGGPGLGAEAGGRPIRVRDHADVATAMVATGFSFDPALRGRQGVMLADLLPQVRDVRRSGSASVDLCAVATGAIDVYYEAALAAWDVSGGAAVAAGAGAVVARGTVEGHPGEAIVAANPELLERFLPVLETIGFDLRT